jgi:hypothetical protein
MRRKLTERQDYAIGRIIKEGGRDYISPDLANQLARRGLVTITGNKYQRHEWQRPVKGTTLWEVRLKST